MSDVAERAVMRASTLLEVGHCDEAERVARDALAADPNDTALLTVLARALLDQERHAEARDEADRALAVDPTNVIALSCAAAAAAGLGRRAEALAAVTRAVELAPNLADLHRQHAEILLARNRRDDALEAARRARRLAPRNATIAAVLGEMLLTNGHVEAARAEISRALELEPQNARAHRAAGRLELHRGSTAESILRYREALRLDPANVVARQGLTTALKSRNRVYRTVLAFEIWLATLPKAQRRATIAGPVVVVRILIAVTHGPLTTSLSVIFLSFIAISWGADPLCNLLLLSNRADRVLLTTAQRRSAIAFGGFAAIAIACFIGAFESRWLIPFGIGFAFWAFVSGATHGMRATRRRALEIIELAAMAVGFAGLACLAIGNHRASVVASAVLLITAIPALIVAMRAP